MNANLALKHKPSVTDRLLAVREQAGEDPAKHARYHRLVTRYQKWLLREHVARKLAAIMRASRKSLGKKGLLNRAAALGGFPMYNIEEVRKPAGKNPRQALESNTWIGKTR
jgi:hypothetical protein